jgi:hypothetical protein
LKVEYAEVGFESVAEEIEGGLSVACFVNDVFCFGVYDAFERGANDWIIVYEEESGHGELGLRVDMGL